MVTRVRGATASDATEVDMQNGETVEDAVNKRTIYVGSVAELEALSGLTAGQEALVSGVPFKYSGTAWEPSAGYISPDCFDAIDDAAATQAAIDYLDPAVGGEIRFNRDKTYTLGQRTIIVPTSNLTLNFNRCQLVMDNLTGTAFEVTPQSLIDSGRKEQLDYPPEWYVGGSPYAYDGEWRTMMFEHRPAERIKNLTIKGCVTDTNFYGTAFQIFSVDGIKVQDCDMASRGHSNLRFWHSTKIRYRKSDFAGSGTYLNFHYKCKITSVVSCDFDSSDSNRALSFKGTYHGGGSVFLQGQAGHVDVAVRVRGCTFSATGTVVSRFIALGIGANSDQDAVGFAGGDPIGFTRLQWVGGYFENVIVQNNSHKSEKKIALISITAPVVGTLFSGNKLYQGGFYVGGATDVNIKYNEMEFDVSDTSSSMAPIIAIENLAIPAIKEIGNIKVIGNTMKGHAGNANEVVSKTHIYVTGKNIEISRNSAITPGANAFFLADLVNSSLTDYVYGEGNNVILDSGSVLVKWLPVQTTSGANLNGGTVQCGVVDTVANVLPGVFQTKVFGAALSVEGLTTAGTVTYGSRYAQYHIINDLCFFQLQVPWSSLTGTGDLIIRGLPFATDDRKSTSFQFVFSVIGIGLTYPAGTLTAYAKPGEDFIRLAVVSSGGGLAPVPVDASGNVTVSGFYPYRVAD